MLGLQRAGRRRERASSAPKNKNKRWWGWRRKERGFAAGESGDGGRLWWLQRREERNVKANQQTPGSTAKQTAGGGCPDCQAFFPRRHREREPGAAFHTTIQGRSTTANEAWRTWLVGADPLLPPSPSTGRSLLARGRDFCLPLRRHHGRICLLVLIRTCSCVDPPLVVEASANFPPGCFPSLMYSGFGAERSSFW